LGYSLLLNPDPSSNGKNTKLRQAMIYMDNAKGTWELKWVLSWHIAKATDWESEGWGSNPGTSGTL